MTREELAVLRGERLGQLLEWCNMKPAEFVRKTEMLSVQADKSKASKILNGKQLLEDFQAMEWIRIFPDYRVEYLLGIDEYPTENDKQYAVTLRTMRKEYDLRFVGFAEMAKSLGFTVRRKTPRDGTFKGYWDYRKGGYVVEKTNKDRVNISEVEYYALVEDITDYVNMRLERIISRKGTRDEKYPEHKHPKTRRKKGDDV